MMKRICFREKKGLSVEAGDAGGMEWNLLLPQKKKKIAVIGISRGAGATFVAVSLAFLLSRSKNIEIGRNQGGQDGRLSQDGRSGQRGQLERRELVGRSWYGNLAAYVEMRPPAAGEPLMYYAAGLDQRFRTGLSGKEKRLHLHRGINWEVWRDYPDHGGEEGIPDPDLAEGFWVVADSPPLESLHQYDLVAAVINPQPASVYAGAENYEILRDLEVSGLPVLWIVNQDNPSVNHGELNRFLRRKAYISLPLIDTELFFQAQYTCRLPVELVEGEDREVLENFAETVRRMVK